jgi:hypothetical protein
MVCQISYAGGGEAKILPKQVGKKWKLRKTGEGSATQSKYRRYKECRELWYETFKPDNPVECPPDDDPQSDSVTELSASDVEGESESELSNADADDPELAACVNDIQGCHAGAVAIYKYIGLETRMTDFVTRIHPNCTRCRCVWITRIGKLLQNFVPCHESWKATRIRQRATKLSKDIADLPGKIRIAMVTLTTTPDFILDTAQVLEFANLRKEINSLISKLKKQLKQQLLNARDAEDRNKQPLKYMGCISKLGTTWDSAYKILDPMDCENLNLQKLHTHAIEAADLIRERVCVTRGEMDAHIGDGRLPLDYRDAILDLVLSHMPVMSFVSELGAKNCMIVDTQGGEEYKDDVTVGAVMSLVVGTLPESKRRNKKSRAKRITQQAGRRAYHTKIKGLVEYVKELVHNNRPVANEKRRNEIVKTGISLVRITELVVSKFPKLEGISSRTIAHLMMPPNAGHLVASKYHKLVKARVTSTNNNRRERQEDQHYARATVKYTREMASYLGSECRHFSTDEKASLVVGIAGLVSRYHKNNKVTPVDCVISKYDHDFKTHGYLISLGGFMELCHPDSYETYEDKHGRTRIKEPVYGPTVLIERSTKYGRPCSDSNISFDFGNILAEGKKTHKKAKIYVVDTDGHVTYRCVRAAVVFLIGQRFIEEELQAIMTQRRAKGDSALNDVEHIWAIISALLAGVIVSDKLPGEDKPPIHQPKLSPEDLLEKEAKIFDHAMKVIRDKITKENGGFSFNGEKVVVKMIPTKKSVEYKQKMDLSHEKLINFNMSNIESRENKAVYERWQLILRHCHHTVYRLIIMACDDPDCSLKQCIAWQAGAHETPRWAEVRNAFKGSIIPTAVDSKTHPGHYMTFLETLKEAQSKNTTFPLPDSNCPSLKHLTPHSCTREEKCSYHFSFDTKAMKDRHDKTMHTKERKKSTQMPLVRPSVQYRCNGCGSVYQLEVDLKSHRRQCNVKPLRQSKGDSVYTYRKRKPGIRASDTRVRVTKKLKTDLVHQKGATGIRERRRRRQKTVDSAKSDSHVNVADPYAFDEDDGECGASEGKSGSEYCLTDSNEGTESDEQSIDGSEEDLVADESKQEEGAWNPPGKGENLPTGLAAGQWVWGVDGAVAIDSGGVTRGLIVNVKKSGKFPYVVRFQDTTSFKQRDWNLTENDLFLTLGKAEDGHRSAREKLLHEEKELGEMNDQVEVGEDTSEDDVPSSLSTEVFHGVVLDQIVSFLDPLVVAHSLASVHRNWQIALVGKKVATVRNTKEEREERGLPDLYNNNKLRRCDAFVLPVESSPTLDSAFPLKRQDLGQLFSGRRFKPRLKNSVVNFYLGLMVERYGYSTGRDTPPVHVFNTWFNTMVLTQHQKHGGDIGQYLPDFLRRFRIKAELTPPQALYNCNSARLVVPVHSKEHWMHVVAQFPPDAKFVVMNSMNGVGCPVPREADEEDEQDESNNADEKIPVIESLRAYIVHELRKAGHSMDGRAHKTQK